jgi:GntR family transcriptional regulator
MSTLSGQEGSSGDMLTMADIDRASAEPFYLQLMRWVEAQIAAGRYGAGDLLPSESQLCRQFSLSRSTVRETLRMLQDRGRIRIVQRRGAFVCGPQAPSWMLQFAEGFSETETEFNKRSVDTRVLRVAFEPLPREAYEALKLPEGSAGVVVERVRRLDGATALYGLNYLIPRLAPVIGDGSILSGSASLNRVLRQAGWHVRGARRSLAAVAANRVVAKHLEIRVGAPLLLIRSVSWNAEETIFDYYSSWLRSEEVPVEIEVQAERRTEYRAI